ncbi:hypothetical protein JCM8097_005393 [Rhodosporidiobolus ruineniae]
MASSTVFWPTFAATQAQRSPEGYPAPSLDKFTSLVSNQLKVIIHFGRHYSSVFGMSVDSNVHELCKGEDAEILKRVWQTFSGPGYSLLKQRLSRGADDDDPYELDLPTQIDLGTETNGGYDVILKVEVREKQLHINYPGIGKAVFPYLIHDRSTPEHQQNLKAMGVLNMSSLDAGALALGEALRISISRSLADHRILGTYDTLAKRLGLDAPFPRSWKGVWGVTYFTGLKMGRLSREDSMRALVTVGVPRTATAIQGQILLAGSVTTRLFNSNIKLPSGVGITGGTQWLTETQTHHDQLEIFLLFDKDSAQQKINGYHQLYGGGQDTKIKVLLPLSPILSSYVPSTVLERRERLGLDLEPEEDDQRDDDPDYALLLIVAFLEDGTELWTSISRQSTDNTLMQLTRLYEHLFGEARTIHNKVAQEAAEQEKMAAEASLGKEGQEGKEGKEQGSELEEPGKVARKGK